MAQQRPLFNKIHIFFHKSGVGCWVTFMTEFSDFRSSRLSDVGVRGAGCTRERGVESWMLVVDSRPRILVPALGALARASCPRDFAHYASASYFYLLTLSDRPFHNVWRRFVVTVLKWRCDFYGSFSYERFWVTTTTVNFKIISLICLTSICLLFT